jgi:hypothetical protein
MTLRLVVYNSSPASAPESKQDDATFDFAFGSDSRERTLMKRQIEIIDRKNNRRPLSGVP